MSDTNRHSKRQFETLHSQIAECKEKLTKVQNSNTKEEILEMKQRIERLKNQLPQIDKKQPPVERKVSSFMELTKAEQEAPPCQVIDASQELSFSQLQKILQPIQAAEENKIEEPLIQYEEGNAFGTKHFNENYFQSIHEQSNTLHSGSYHKIHTNTYANMLLTEKTNAQVLVQPAMVTPNALVNEVVKQNTIAPITTNMEQQAPQKMEQQTSYNTALKQLEEQPVILGEPRSIEQQPVIEEESQQIEQQLSIEEEPQQTEQQLSTEQEPKEIEQQSVIEEEPKQIAQQTLVEEEPKETEQQPVIEGESQQVEQQPPTEEELQQVEQQLTTHEEPQQIEQQFPIQEEPTQTEEPAFISVQLESPIQQLEPSIVEQLETPNIQEAQNDDEAPKKEKYASFWNFFRRKR